MISIFAYFLTYVNVFPQQFLISYNSSVFLKVWSMLHHGLVNRIQNKECYVMFSYTFLTFFVYLFVCFSSWNLCFYHFHFFFGWSIKFPQQNINHSEIGVGAECHWQSLFLEGALWNVSTQNLLLWNQLLCRKPALWYFLIDINRSHATGLFSDTA